MAKLFLELENRPKGEEIEVQGPGSSWRVVCPNGGSVDIPADEDMHIPPMPPSKAPVETVKVPTEEEEGN